MRQPDGFYDDLASPVPPAVCRLVACKAGAWRSSISERETTYRALRRDTLTAALSHQRVFATGRVADAGVECHDQPVVLAVADGTPSTGLPGASSGNCAVTVKRPSAHRTAS